MFDKDMNNDISMSELEAVCVDIGKERKSITASLKDLDSVVAKLDAVLLFFVLTVTVLVFLSLISRSAAGVLTSAGSAVLALSWLFSATAQEFLQSCIFVLVKHPFDVGDRITIYGNTGAALKGDDYLVKEISLLYTEFKKMEGHIVQAPNSYLNTLFILNMRRSGGLAEAVPLTVKFGTTLDQIDELRSRLLEYVKAEKREYQPNILTEIRDIVEAYSVNLNVVFFYKSNWQNELLRLQRRNKFICAMMVSMQEIGIEGPRKRIPGANEDTPFYYHQTLGPNHPNSEHKSDPGPRSGSLARDPAFVPNASETSGIDGGRSILRNGSQLRPRGESISAMSKRVDFSLGMKDVISTDIMDNMDTNRSPSRLPDFRTDSISRSRETRARITEDDEAHRREDEATIRWAESRKGNSRSPFGMGRRTSTDSQSKTRRGSSLIHRNRFFSRGKRTDDEDEERDLMEQGMADIPEAAGVPARMDPRTGIVSPKAVRLSTESEDSIAATPAAGATSSGGLDTLEGRLRLAYPGGNPSEAVELRDMNL